MPVDNVMTSASSPDSSLVEDRIKEASAHNRELLQILSETDHAVPALEQQKRYITDLENDSLAAQRRIDHLDKHRQEELKEHAKYRDSIMRRFAYKVGGRTDQFEQRAAKEEREYFEILQQEHQAKEMKRSIDDMLAQARQTGQQLEQAVERHRQAERGLDSLYDSIFQGPSPGFPEEDEKEAVSAQTLQDYHFTTVAVETEDQALRILKDAQSAMRTAMFWMQDALKNSNMDIFGGGSLIDMLERNALSKAQFYVSNARMLVDQARRISPAVRGLPPVRIAQGRIIGDVFFDTIFDDIAFHKKIQASNFEVERCAIALNQLLDETKARRMGLSADLQEKAKRLEEARVALQNSRKAAFERVTGESTSKLIS